MASPSSFPSVSTTEQDHPSSTSASGEAAEADIPPAETNSSFVDKEAKKSGAWIRYSIEWQDLNGKFKSRQVVEQPGAEVDELGDAASEMPAFEQVSVFQTKHGKDTNVDANLGVGAAPTLYLRIYSVAIIHALRSVVRYYPQQDLSGDIVEVTWPFPVLVHHFDELRDFREACIKKDQSEACIRERHVDTHVGLLLDFLNEELMDNVRSEKELTKTRHRTFDYLWASLKPGTTVYTEIREGPRWLPGVIHSVSGEQLLHSFLSITDSACIRRYLQPRACQVGRQDVGDEVRWEVPGAGVSVLLDRKVRWSERVGEYNNTGRLGRVRNLQVEA